MNKKELEEKVLYLEEKVRTFEDIEQIKIVQRAYGYYMDNLMYDDAADLFSDDCYAQFGTTIITGRENLKKSFNTFTTERFEGTKKLFLKFQLMGVVHVEKGGQPPALARWRDRRRVNWLSASTPLPGQFARCSAVRPFHFARGSRPVSGSSTTRA